MRLPAILVLLYLAGGNSWGQTYQVLHRFDASDGRGPHSPLVLSGGALYGTIGGQGGNDLGEVFKINTDGTGFTVLKRFAGLPGGVAFPQPSLILSGTSLYGTTVQGGTPPLHGGSSGTIFKMDVDGGDFTVLKALNADSDGAPPLLVLIDGNTLYGTAYGGGTPVAYGTVFKINIDGSGFTLLKTFSGQDGIEPYKLVKSAAILYGTTSLGGAYGKGTVFRLNRDGSGFAVVKHFTGLDAAYPGDSLVLARSTLYGATFGGGSCCGTLFRIDLDGDGCRVIKAFDPPADGYLPYGDLLISGTTLYGTAEEDGPSGGGTVFKLHADGGGFTVLQSFGVPDGFGVGPSEGSVPTAGLARSGRTLYGTTLEGGLSNGVIFALSLPLTAPDLVCPGAAVLECTNGQAMTTLDVQLSDSSGNPVVVVWSVEGMPYQTNNVAPSELLDSIDLTFTADFAWGKHVVMVSASNGETAPAVCFTTVEVRDTIPPQILSVSATPDVLWPPNHQMVPVAVEVKATDNCGPTTSKIVAVSSNEPAGPSRGGPDWLITGDLSVDLRADQPGNENPRIYTIWVECDDAAGNSSFGSVTVTVRHDERQLHRLRLPRAL